MTRQKKHEKRRKRTSLKKADQYRREAAFFKQRNKTLVGDLRGEQEDKTQLSKVMTSSREKIAAEYASLDAKYDRLNRRHEWINSLLLVRFILLFTSYRKSA